MRSVPMRKMSEPAESLDGFDPRPFLRPGLTEKDVVQIKEVFDTFDVDCDGVLNPMEIRSAMIKFGFQAKKETVFNILSEYDEESEGSLSFQSFINMCAKNHNQRKENKGHIRTIFIKYDTRKQGYFDVDDLKKMAKDLGENADDEILKEMIESLDSNMDGKVTFDDFYNAMTKRMF